MSTADRKALRVLVVSAYAAPSAAVGAKRFAYLVRRFEDLGLRVEVLSLRAAAQDRRDASLPCAGSVFRSASWLPFPPRRSGWAASAYKQLLSRVLGVPDPYIGWLLPGVLAGRRLIRRARPDVIVASGPPFTAFLIGAILARQGPSSLVLDYRDPWTGFDWSAAERARLRHGRLSRRLERWVIARAGALVFASAAMREQHVARFEPAPRQRTAVITNGYEAGLEPPANRLPAGALNILYAGNFYGERSIHPLAAAVAALTRDGRIGAAPAAIHVFGRLKPADRARILESGAADLVREHEPVDHAEVLGYMKAADVLYLPSGGDVLYALPFKLFDYLSVRRPILALAPERSAVAALLREVDCGELAERPDRLAEALERLLSRRRAYAFKGAERYAWGGLSRRYVGLLNELCGRPELSPAESAPEAGRRLESL